MTRDSMDRALHSDGAVPRSEEPVPPFIALQRVVVRMLFDPAFVDRVHDRPGDALAGLDLDPALVRQLVANDRRLWNADRLRRSRSLKVLMEEYKVSSTLALAERGKLGFLDGFFGSRSFHDAVQGRGYVSLAYAAYLEDALAEGTLRSPHLRAALGLEASMARSRRLLREARRGRDAGLAPVARGPARDGLVAAPGVLCHRAPGGTLALVQHVERYLFQVSQVPALALCDDAPRPEPLPELHPGVLQPFLLEPRPDGKVDLSEIGAEYAEVVDACRQPIGHAGLAERLGTAGIEAADAEEMAGSLVEAGVLRRVRVAEDGTVREVASNPGG